MENLNVNAWAEIKNNKDAFILDVRTLEEFNEGHISGAVNIDIYSPLFLEEVAKLDKSLDYYVVCKAGGRSMSAAGAMENMGFTKVTNLAGGMMDWMGEVE